MADEKGAPSIAAVGWLNQMQSFQTFFGLKLGKVS